jgi:hypothetical protein
VRFEDEEFEDHEERSDDENPFGRGGRFDRRHHHRRADFEDRGFHRGRHHYDGPDNIAQEEMKRVMKRHFAPSSYERDLMNRLQTLRQGKRLVDEYFKEMELLLIRTGTRESMESKMARFLGGLNEEITGFVKMFPYHTLQDLVDQAMRTEWKIQQESHGRSYGSHSIAAPWRK